MLETQNQPRYLGEYAYRQGPGFERQLPDYLQELVEAAHNGLTHDPDFAAICSIDTGKGSVKYRLSLDRSGITATIRINGEEEDTYRPASRFEELGGARDILAQLVENGGLPEVIDPNSVHIEYL